MANSVMPRTNSSSSTILFTNATSKQKWSSCHPGRHEEWYYMNQEMELQKRFLAHFLMGKDNGWGKEPSVIMRERKDHSTRTSRSSGTRLNGPLPKTKRTIIFFSAENQDAPALSWSQVAEEENVRFDALEEPMILGAVGAGN